MSEIPPINKQHSDKFSDELLQKLVERKLPESLAEMLPAGYIVPIQRSELDALRHDPAWFIPGLEVDESKASYGDSDWISGRRYRGEGRYSSVNIIIVRPWIISRGLSYLLGKEPKTQLHVEEDWENGSLL